MVRILEVLAFLLSLTMALPVMSTSPYAPAPVVTWAGTGSHGAEDGPDAQFNLPGAVFGPAAGGERVVLDTHNNLVRVIDGYGYTSWLAGAVLVLDEFGFPLGAMQDGPAYGARFNRPTGGVVDARGRIFIADSQNHTIRLLSEGMVYTFAGGLAYGHVDGRPEEARFNLPTALAMGPCGGLFVTDTLNHVVRRVGPDGTVTTIAGTPGVYGHQDGAAAQAVFNSPQGIAVADNGTIFVADTGNHMIRVVAGGVVQTLAGALIFPEDIAWEDAEDADFDHEPLGGFADGYQALFNLPVGLALWGDVLLVADSVNHRIRAVLPGGRTLTLAGSGYADFADGPPARAAFHFPRGVFVQGDYAYVADTGNNMIRRLPLAADTFN